MRYKRQYYVRYKRQHSARIEREAVRKIPYVRGTSTTDRKTLHIDQNLPLSIYLRNVDPLAELELGPTK